MATTSLWKIRTRLDHVVDYVSNTEKTLNPHTADSPTADLQTVIEYAGESYKTEQQQLVGQNNGRHFASETAEALESSPEAFIADATVHFVSGLNCSPETAYSAMRTSFARNDKPLRVLGYHGYQSFTAGEVSAQTAHEIGAKLAQEMWGERFQVVIATHLNTGHYHNHFVVCSTSFLDGKRYNYNGKERRRMMQVSDRLCREHTLSVVETPQTARTVSYMEWQAAQNGQPTKRSLVRADIDAALTECFTPKQFTQAMTRMGYVLNFDRKHPTLKAVSAERAFRFDSLGSGYTMEDIKARIVGNYRAPEPISKQQPLFKTYRYKGVWKSNSNHKNGVHGLRALYYHYCYLLGVFPHKRQNSKRMYAVLHDDIIRMDKTIKASRLLFAHQIDTQEQLFAYMAQNAHSQTDLTDTRQHLRRSLRALQDGAHFTACCETADFLADSTGACVAAQPESLRKETAPDKQDALKRQISAVSERLKALRKEQNICEDVAERSGIVAQNTKLTRQEHSTQQRKEKSYESRRRRC